MQGVARLVTQAVSGDSEEQLGEDEEGEPAFSPDRNPIDIAPGSRKRELGSPSSLHAGPGQGNKRPERSLKTRVMVEALNAAGLPKGVFNVGDGSRDCRRH